MADPESIDVKLSLFDDGALDNLKNEIIETRKLLEDIKGNTFTGTGALPVKPGGTSTGGASRAQAAGTSSGGGGSQSYYAPTPGTVSGSMPWTQISAPGAPPTNAAVQPVSMPSTGDFGAQDVFSRSAGWAGGRAYQNAVTSPTGQKTLGILDRLPLVTSVVQPGATEGTFKPGISSATGEGIAFGVANQALANVGGAAGNIISAANPWSNMAASQAQGVPGGSIVHVGPFGFRPPFGAATAAGFQNTGEALSALIQGGKSPGDVQQIQDALAAGGYRRTDGTQPASDSDYANMYRLMNNIQTQNGGVLAGLDKGQLGANLQQLVQLGAASQNQLENLYKSGSNSFQGLSDAASSAGLSLNDFMGQVQEAGGVFSSMGLTGVQGQITAQQLSVASNLPPNDIAALAQNPFIQGNIMRKSGLPVAAQGLYAQTNPGGFMGAAYQSIHQLVQSVSGVAGSQREQIAPGVYRTVSGQKEGAAIASQTTGLPVELINNVLKYGKQDQVQNQLGAVGQLYGGEVRHAAALYGEGSPRYNKVISNLEGKMGQKAGWADIQPLLHKAGFDKGTIANIEAQSPANRAKAIQAAIDKSAHKHLNPNPSRPEVKVGFTGLAEKFFKQIKPGMEASAQARKDQNQGGPVSTITGNLKDAASDPWGLIKNAAESGLGAAGTGVEDAAGSIGSSAEGAVSGAIGSAFGG